MAAVKFYFRCLVIVLFILCASARTHTSHSHHSHISSHGLSGHASKHSYPTSPGLSGHHTSHASYPSSGGLSGSGQPSAAYPSSPGLFGTGSGSRNPVSYPSSSGLSGTGSGSSNPVSYPSSTGLSGIGSGSRNPVSYPASPGLSGTGSGSNNPGTSYPPSNGLLGNSPSTSSGYPHPKITFPVARPNQNVYPNNMQQNTQKEIHHHHTNTHTVVHHGLSGSPSTGSGYPNNIHHNTHKEVHHYHTNTHTVVHHHNYGYVYKPPTVIHYTPAYGMNAVSYPVYTGHHVPSYVYEYRSSNNKYKMLLAGLALYNLGMVSANPTLHNYHKHYTVRPDEVCKFGVRYEYGSYEEMVIDCRAITNFIWEDESKPKLSQQLVNQTVVTTSVQTQTLLPNGTLGYPGLGANTALLPNGTLLNTTNTIITTTTEIKDRKFDGSPVAVASGMECYVLRFTSYSSMRKTVSCGLLNTYAAKSLRNYDVALKSPAPWILIIMTVALKIAF